MPELQTYDELAFVMKYTKAFSDNDIQKSVGEIKAMTQSETCQVGIKKILLGIETAKQDRDMAYRFAGVMARSIAERSAYQ